MEQHFTTKQVSLHSVSITYHCILQQRKPPEALQCPGTADWLFLQQQTLDLSMGEKQNEKIYISIQLNSKYLKGATKKVKTHFLTLDTLRNLPKLKLLLEFPSSIRWIDLELDFQYTWTGSVLSALSSLQDTHSRYTTFSKMCSRYKGKCCSMWINLWLTKIPNDFMNKNSGGSAKTKYNI